MSQNGEGTRAEDAKGDSLSKISLIPKFSSFKAAPQLLPKTETPVPKEEKKKRQRTEADRKSHEHRKRVPEDKRSRSRSPSKHRDKRRRTASLSPPPQPISTDIYKVDTKGDSANMLYGTTYRYSVPSFHRFGAGYILGLDPKWRIEREKGEGKGLVVGIRGLDVDRRRKGGNIFAVDAARVGRLKISGDVTKGFDPNEEFVSITGRIEPVNVETFVPELDYRSIEGKAKTTRPEDVESVSSDDEETFSYDDEIKQRTIELDRKLQSHPHDIQAWLDYASLQDEIGVGQKASTAEIKLGILRKGLEKNPGNIRLFVELFKIENILWEPKKVLAHWEEVLQKYDSPNLILEYLNYRQTSFVSFTYPEMVATYARCLRALRSLAWAAIPSEKSQIESMILYIIQRFAHLAREAGYDELGIACFQGLIELNIFRLNIPAPSTETTRDAELGQFEEFWDSECARFGEEGAKGWRSFDPDNPADGPSASDVAIHGASIEDWYRRQEASKWRMPGRTTDNLEEDDPYRVVLFNDIRPFLYAFTTDIVNQLPYAFLTFCGLNLPLPDASSDYPQSTDSWLHNDFNTQGFWPVNTNANQIEWINGEAVDPERLPGIATPFEFKRKVYPVDIDTLFPFKGTWFKRLELNEFPHTPFLLTGLSQLKPLGAEEWFMIYHLAIENLLSPSTVLKLAKSYIKSHKSSTVLWCVYALLLWNSSDYAESRKIFTRAIEMTFSTHDDPVLLWQTWITCEFLLEKGSARNLFSLVSAGRPDFDAPRTIGGAAGELRIRKYLQEKFDWACSFKKWRVAEGYANLGILFEYLTSLKIEEVVDKCRMFTDALKGREQDGSVAHERIQLYASKVLVRHAQTEGWYRVYILRDFWADAIDRFPRNTAFLSLFAWNEASARIDGRVRKLLSSMEKTATVDTWVFAIWAEISIERGRVSEFAVRAIFEKAAEEMKTSILLWTMNIEFEARYGTPRRAKELIFRAIRECPWSKDLAMKAFGTMRELFDNRELARVYNVLMEKEIRIHVELESMEEGPTKAIELPVDPDSDDD